MNISDLVSLVELGRIVIGAALLAFIAWIVVPRVAARQRSRALHTDRQT